MKSTVVVGISKTARGLFFRWSQEGLALIALVLTVQSHAAVFNVDVSGHTLYTDPIHPERQIKLGGFSGLVPVPGDHSGAMFYTVTDRGPTQDFPVVTTAPDGTLTTNTYKVLPCHDMAPMIVKLHLQSDGTARVLQRIPLQRLGRHGFVPITGRANGVELAPEILSDASYRQLAFDPDGLDPEGITIDHWGNFWICEEYRPSMAMIGHNGAVLLRLVPKGCKTGREAIPTFDILPAVLVKRVNNRGMEGIAWGSNGRLYGIMQRPLANPTSETSRNLRIVEVNLRSFLGCGRGPHVRQLIYRADSANAKVYASDICALSSEVMLVPERKTDKLYAINISEATDVTPFETEDGKLIADPTKTIEQLEAADLASLGIQPVKKSVVVTKLTDLHKELAKCEGVAVVGGTIVLTYDNDFNLGDFGDGTTTPGSIQLKSPDVYPALITVPLPEEIVFEN